jgi:hypothetical protein
MKKRKKINDGVKFTIIAVVLIAIFCIAITPVTLQNDTYYTIKIGEHIQNNGIDMKDQFSWHEDLNYTYPHWLYDLLTYKIYSQFGMMGIYLTTCLLSCILGITLFFVSSKISKNKLISFFVTIGAMYLLKGYIAARAQLVTFILFILSLYFIEKFLENRKIRYGIGIVLISTLIANLHVAVWPFLFILFLPYIGEYLIAVLADLIIYKKVQERLLKIKIKYSSNNKEALEKFQKELDELQAKVSKIKIKRSKSIQNPYKIKITKNKNVKWLIVIMIICAFTGLLTPLGDTPYTYLAKTMQGNTTKNINEHLPMTIAEQPEVLCTIIIFLAVLTFTKIKIKLSDLFMIGGLAFLMLESRRQLSMFSLIGSVILSKLIVELITCYDKELLEKINKKILHPFIIICMIVLVGWQTYDNVKTKYNDKFIDETQYPVKACDYILENIDLSKARFYNEYNYGSYMIYRGIPVFIDSRADLYAPEFSGLKDDIFTDFIDVSSIGTFYEDILEKYNITHVILYSNSKMSMIIDETKDPHYSKIYKDDYFVIYERVK